MIIFVLILFLLDRNIIDEPDSTLKHLLKTINDFEDLKYKVFVYC